jgi:AFG3 family protein
MKKRLNRQPDQGSERIKNDHSKIISWIGLLSLIVAAFILPSLLIKTPGKEITWKQFNQEILAKRSVEKIIIVNNERADIYIKKEFLNDPQFQGVFQNSIAEKVNPAPQYFIKIISTEFFERRLNESQKNIPLSDRITVTYTKENDWIWYLIIWLLRIFTLLILVNLFIPKIYFK